MHRLPLGGPLEDPVRWAEFDFNSLYVAGRKLALPAFPVVLFVVVEMGPSGDTTETVTQVVRSTGKLPKEFWERLLRRRDGSRIVLERWDKEGMVGQFLASQPGLARMFP